MRRAYDKRFRARIILAYGVAILVSVAVIFLYHPLAGMALYLLSSVIIPFAFNRSAGRVTHYIKDNYPALYKKKTDENFNNMKWRFTLDLTPAVNIMRLSEEEISSFADEEMQNTIYRARFTYRVWLSSFVLFIVSAVIIGNIFPLNK